MKIIMNGSDNRSNDGNDNDLFDYNHDGND